MEERPSAKAYPHLPGSASELITGRVRLKALPRELHHAQLKAFRPVDDAFGQLDPTVAGIEPGP